MKVWITKYALTDGIIETDSENGARSIDLYWGDCHLSRESEIKKAEEMRQKKIESLKKQIKKLEKMRFE